MAKRKMKTENTIINNEIEETVEIPIEVDQVVEPVVEEVKKDRIAVVSNCKSVNFRNTPAKKKGNIISVIPCGHAVTIIKDMGEWTRVKYGKTVGYIMTSFIMEK